MKVSHVTTRLIRTPADNPLVVGIDVGNATRDFVTLELGTDQGLVGIGLTFFGVKEVTDWGGDISKMPQAAVTHA